MESARAFAPLREGGAVRRKMACGLRVRSGSEGRRGEYCGGPSMQASAWSIRRGIVSFIAGAESHLPRRPNAVLPPSRPLPLVFCHASAVHSWPRRPPLGGGRVLSPFLHLEFVEFHGWFLKIPRSTGNAKLSMRLAGTRRRRDSPPCHMRKDELGAVLAQASDKSEGIPFLACRCTQTVLHPERGVDPTEWRDVLGSRV